MVKGVCILVFVLTAACVSGRFGGQMGGREAHFIQPIELQSKYQAATWMYTKDKVDERIKYFLKGVFQLANVANIHNPSALEALAKQMLDLLTKLREGDDGLGGVWGDDSDASRFKNRETYGNNHGVNGKKENNDKKEN